MNTAPRFHLSACALALCLTGATFAQLTPEGSERRSNRVEVCHFDARTGTYSLLTVPSKAADNHVRHGDCLVDDGVDCTIDRCDADAGCVHALDDSVCDDGVFCNGVESCSPTGCVAISSCPPVVLDCGELTCDEENDACVIIPNDAECDDGNPCTDDACDAGICVSTPDDTNSCDDGVFCNGPETCSGGSCVVVSACPPVVLECGELTCDEDNDACVIVPDDAACDDGVDCTVDTCDAEGNCSNVPDDSACDDGLFCNGTESCSPEGCVAISACPPVLLECGALTCDEDNDTCVIVPNDDECNTTDQCVVGRCTGEGMCAFDPVPACTFTASALCDDGDVCTAGDSRLVDVCTGDPCSECAGQPLPPCSVNESAPCDDGDACTQFDAQQIDSCTGEPCGECVGEPLPACTVTESAPCDDGDPNTQFDEQVIDSCTGEPCGPCMGVSPPPLLPDGAACFGSSECAGGCCCDDSMTCVSNYSAPCGGCTATCDGNNNGSTGFCRGG